MADTIIPGAGNPLAWDRYAYTLNNPIRYNDPSGHYACEDVDENGKCIPEKQKHPEPTDPTEDIDTATDVTYVYTPDGQTVIIFMPPGSNRNVSRPDWAMRLGTSWSIAGFLFDVGEMGLIFCPQAGQEDTSALWDTFVTYAASLLSGLSYTPFDNPPDGLPPSMITFNQDTLVTAGDAAIALGAKVVGTGIGGQAGHAVGKAVDVGTTGASLVHDYNRNFGSLQSNVAMGVSFSPDFIGKKMIIIWQ